MSEVVVLYSCVVCDKSFSKKQSLMAHMRVHQNIEWKQFHVRLPKDVVDAFEAVCRKHKTTTCHLIRTLMKATIVGEERGIIDVATKNPMIVQMQEFFGGRPRSHNKYTVGMDGAVHIPDVTPCAYVHCGCQMPAVETLRLPAGSLTLCSAHLEYEKKKRKLI